MNTVFILGNGFDLNLGLKTSYGDFYDFYRPTKSSSPSIKRLKEKIGSDYENWSDLECALGKETSSFGNAKDFVHVYDDMMDKLSEYLQEQEKKFEPPSDFKKILYEGLAFPEEYLTNTQKQALKAHRARWGNQTNDINIISFNYTKIFENIVDEEYPIIISATGGVKATLHGISHVHGYTDQNMILGVNDPNQVANKEFCHEQDFLETVIKETRNQAIEHGIEVLCKRKIENANLIVIFGSSLGDTDLLWWDLVARCLLEDTVLLVFKQQAPFSPNRQNALQSIKRELIDSFLSKTSLSDDEKEGVKSKIYLGVNSNIFKFDDIG